MRQRGIRRGRLHKHGSRPAGRPCCRWAPLILASLLLLWPLQALAAEQGEGEGHGHSPSVRDLIYPALNIGLFLYLLRRAGRGSVRTYLEDRRTQLMAAFDEAASAHRQSAQAHAAMRSKLDGADAEIAQIRADMRAIADGEQERRRKLVSDAAQRITRDARMIADHEAQAALAALREETVNAAVAETLSLLRRQIKGPDQERFLGDFVGQLRARAQA